MKILRIKETCLYVADLDRTQEFYADKLGLELYSHVKGRHVFFRAGESMLLCFNPEVTKYDQKLPPHYAEGKMHLAFECSPEEYAGWKEKVRHAGIAITHEQQWGNGKSSFYFEDPDGHVLEIVEETIW